MNRDREKKERQHSSQPATASELRSHLQHATCYIDIYTYDACVHVYIYICIHIHVRVYACVCMYIYVRHEHMYIYTHTHFYSPPLSATAVVLWPHVGQPLLSRARLRTAGGGQVAPGAQKRTSIVYGMYHIVLVCSVLRPITIRLLQTMVSGIPLVLGPRNKIKPQDPLCVYGFVVFWASMCGSVGMGMSLHEGSWCVHVLERESCSVHCTIGTPGLESPT